MTDRIEAGVQAFRPSLSYRFWRALGFRYSAFVPPPDEDDAQYARHRIVAHWDCLDRLRILLSGKTETSLLVETEEPMKFKSARSVAVVLAPGAKVQ